MANKLNSMGWLLAELAVGSLFAANAMAAPVTISISAQPQSITSGGVATLSWSSNAAKCSASGGWSGSKPAVGAATTHVLSATTTFTLSCVRAGQSGRASATVNVVGDVVPASAPAPTISFSANPQSVIFGANSTLSWSSTNADACSAAGNWTGSKALSGSALTGPIYANSIFTLACSGTGGTIAQTVTVSAYAGPPPTVNLMASPNNIYAGANTSLSWWTTDATQCNASDAWSGSRGTAGSESSTALNAESNTFTLTCSGPGGSATSSALVLVMPVAPTPAPTPVPDPTPAPPAPTPVPDPTPAPPAPGPTPSPVPPTTPPPAPPTAGYTTNFAATESPLSDGGIWIDGKAVGLDWNDPRSVNGKVYASVRSGLGESRYDDNIAVLNTAFAENQFAQATVYRDPGYSPGNAGHEVELLLHFRITAHNARGYEVLWGHSGYIAVVRWNGGLGDYTALLENVDPGIGVPTDGDVLRAEIANNVITVYKNGTLVASVDTTSLGGSVWSDGQPGLAFWPVQDATVDLFGWKSYQAGSL